MKNSIVSIITPVYNAKNYFLDTFESVINQNFIFWEWIIVDDCSSDGTYEYIKEKILNDSRIILLKTEHNSGAATARNIGIENASGQFIAFLDADDLWKPNKLEIQVKFMQENDCSFSCSNYDVLKTDSSIVKIKSKNKDITYKMLLKTNEIGCLTAMYDVKKIGKIYMPLDAPKREDHATWLDITKKGIVAKKIPDSLALYRLTDESVSSNKVKMLRYQYMVYRNHEKFNFFKSHWYLLQVILHKLFKRH